MTALFVKFREKPHILSNQQLLSDFLRDVLAARNLGFGWALAEI
jgi:hypothetical protein